MSLWISVLEIGTFYGLLALAYLLVIEGARIFNFLVGAYAMVAAMLTSWLCAQGWSLVAAIGFSIAAAGVAAVLTEVGLIGPIQRRSRDELSALIAVTAGLLLVQQVAATVMGRELLPGQEILTGAPIEVGGSQISRTGVLQIVVTLLAFTCVHLYLSRTGAGRSLRAVGSNEEAAHLIGLPVARIRLYAFLASGILAAIAGILFAARGGVSFQSAFPWTIFAFLAIVIGGTGAVWSPLVGGLILGCMQVFIPRYLGSELLDYSIFAVALVFFAFRPEGVFTRRVRI